MTIGQGPGYSLTVLAAVGYILVFVGLCGDALLLETVGSGLVGSAYVTAATTPVVMRMKRKFSGYRRRPKPPRRPAWF